MSRKRPPPNRRSSDALRRCLLLAAAAGCLWPPAPAAAEASGVELLLLRGAYRRAIETHRLGENLAPRDRFLLAFCYQEAGEHETAALIWEGLLAGPEAAGSLLALAHARLRAGRADEADRLYRRFLADFPRSSQQPAALAGLARVFARQGRSADQHQLLVQLRRHYPFSPEAEEAGRALTRDRGAYSLQVGSFGELARAEALARTLVEKGHDAYLLRLLGDRISYRVRVGNFADQAAARLAGDRLAGETGLAYFVAHGF